MLFNYRNYIHLLLTSASVLPGLAMAAEEDQSATIVVTGNREKPYAVDTSVSATKTDAPIMKVPQVVNVVPEQVLLDQQVQSLTEALRNVSGITETNGSFFGNTMMIRGFGPAG